MRAVRGANRISMVHPIDASTVYVDGRGTRLMLGSFPPAGPDLAVLGIRRLALCAFELQRPPEDYPGVGLYHVPMDDTEDVDKLVRVGTFRHAIGGAIAVARAVRRGRTTLSTCRQGRNRSALVAGLALRMLTNWSGDMVVEWLRRHRPHVAVLTNECFVRCLCRREPVFERELARVMAAGT